MRRLTSILAATAIVFSAVQATAQTAAQIYGRTGAGRPQGILVDDDGTVHTTGPGGTPSSISNTDFGADCLVVSGNQAYTVGTTQRCTMTVTGRIKIGQSSATNIDGAAQPANTLDADLTACKYRATPGTLSDLWTQALRCNADGSLSIGGATTPTPNLYPLLTNTNVSGSLVSGLVGGGYLYDLRGALGGATVSLKISDASGALQTSTTNTFAGVTCLTIGQGSNAQVIVTGGTPSGLYAKLEGITGPCPAYPAQPAVQQVDTMSSTTLVSTAVVVKGDFDVTIGVGCSATFAPQRQFSGDTTWYPLTSGGTAITYTGPVSEVLTEPKSGVLYRLSAPSIAGTCTVRIEQ